jgi:hypothetical protein
MARGVSQKFVKEWRAKLAHADRVWESRGLAKSAGSASFEDELKQYLAAYRGESWAPNGWAGLAPADLSVTPIFFAAQNTFVANLLARVPEADVLPRNRTSIDRAPIVETVINYDIDELKMKREWSLALGDSFSAPWGMVRHGYTPADELTDAKDRRIEPYAMARPNKPWMRRHKIWDFRCDPLAESPQPDGDAMWCAFRSLYTEAQLRGNPRMTLPDDLAPTRDVTVWTKDRTKKLSSTPTFAVWSVYDRRDKTWFQIPDDGDTLYRQPDDWPIPWEDLPYDTIYFNPQMDTLFPVPYAAAIWHSVLELNKVRTLMVELVKRTRRLVLLNKDQLAEGEADKIESSDLTEIVLVTGNLANAMGQVQVGGFASELIGLVALYEKDIREAIGQSAMDRGQRINVESSFEAQNVAQGSAINGGRNIEATEDFLSSSLRHYAIARQATTTEDEIVPIVGRKLAGMLRETKSYFSIAPADLAGEFDYKVVPGSSLPDNRQRRIKEAMAKLEIAKSAVELHDMQEAYARVWEAFGDRPGDLMLDKKQLERTVQTPGAQTGDGADRGADMGALMMGMRDQDGGGSLQ